MIDEFWIRTRPAERGNWQDPGMGHETPTTKAQAVEQIRDMRLSLGDDAEFCVMWLESDTARFTDVTLSIVGKADELDARDAHSAALDARHVRQETLGWENAQ